MKVKDILAVLEAIAPPHLQESYDNAGLIVGHPEAEVTGVLFCLDSTEAVVEEALTLGCNLVVAHHPIVFRGLKRFNGSSYVERTVMQAIRKEVALYAIHTNLDNVYYQGVNAKIAEKIGLSDTRILLPRRESPDSGLRTQDSGLRTSDSGLLTGAGMIGLLPQPMAETEFLQHVKSALRASCVRHTALRNKPVEKVAVCGGSGSFLLSEALRSGADAFVTADFKYHEFFDAEGRLVIADIGHFETEQFTIELLFDIIREKFPTFALHCTKVNTNPVFYL
ncbi:MAG: Nif3-like dinuclear metal center hexameric protein [Saprospiraceae bacterium]|nr:Nif3-like dinuclear metal center hexameric protein [Saprospiraceae bacterium]